MTEERKVGHTALRVKNGELETFDPHPSETDEEGKGEEKFEEWIKKNYPEPPMSLEAGKEYSIRYYTAKKAYLQGRRDEAKERQEEIEKLKEALDLAIKGHPLSDPKWKEAK